MVSNIQDIPGVSPVAHQLDVTSAAKPVHVFGDLGYLNLYNELFAFPLLVGKLQFQTFLPLCESCIDKYLLALDFSGCVPLAVLRKVNTAVFQ